MLRGKFERKGITVFFSLFRIFIGRGVETGKGLECVFGVRGIKVWEAGLLLLWYSEVGGSVRKEVEVGTSLLFA